MQSGTVIWRRRIDEDAERRKVRNFTLGYCVVLLALAALMYGVGGWSGFAGTLVLGGILGVLICGWVWLHSQSLQIGPPIAIDDGHFVRAEARIPIDSIRTITCFSTDRPIVIPRQDALTQQRASHYRYGAVRIELDDGRREQFEYIHLTGVELAGLRRALKANFPGRWVDPPKDTTDWRDYLPVR